MHAARMFSWIFFDENAVKLSWNVHASKTAPPHDWLFLDSKVFNVTAVHLNRLTAIDLGLAVGRHPQV